MIMLRVWAKISIVLIKEITMIGAVMFLGGFFASLLAFYGRNAPLLMSAVILLAFCWVGNERVHKAFRLIPSSLSLIMCIRLLPHTSIYNLIHYYDFTALLSAIITAFLLVSMRPTGISKRRAPKKGSSFAITMYQEYPVLLRFRFWQAP